MATTAALVLLVLGGCATTPPPPPAEPAAELQPEATQTPATNPVPKPKPSTPAPVQPPVAEPVKPSADTKAPQPAPALAGPLVVRIETNPKGAMILVDGRPVGRAPVEITVETANNGFFKEPVTIRARFLATDPNSETFSIDEQLTPLERVPLSLVFSKEGVQRILRQF